MRPSNALSRIAWITITEPELSARLIGGGHLVGYKIAHWIILPRVWLVIFWRWSELHRKVCKLEGLSNKGELLYKLYRR